MTWKAAPPIIETAATWTAATGLGGAVAFAVARLGPLGAGIVEAGVAGAFVALVTGVLVGRIDRQRGLRPAFVAAEPLEQCLVPENLLLTDQRGDDDALLLDDPLPAVGDTSRVVRLFAAQPFDAANPVPLAEPGEMAARIENFLGQARGGAVATGSVPIDDRAAGKDASAALHAALADIRRSLRHG